MVKLFNFCFMIDFFNRYIWGNCNEREREERDLERERVRILSLLIFLFKGVF